MKLVYNIHVIISIIRCFFGLYDSIGTILSVLFRGPVNISYIHLATRVRDGLPRLNTSDPKITQWITTPTIN